MFVTLLIPILFVVLLLAVIVVAYWQDASPWRYCPRCHCFWHRKKLTQTRRMPPECEGRAKTQVCRLCE